MKFLRFLGFFAVLSCVNFGVAYGASTGTSGFGTPENQVCDGTYCYYCDDNGCYVCDDPASNPTPECRSYCANDEYGAPGETCSSCSNYNSNYALSVRPYNRVAQYCFRNCGTCNTISDSTWAAYFGSTMSQYFSAELFARDPKSPQLPELLLLNGNGCDMGTNYCTYNVSCETTSSACKPGHVAVEFRDANNNLIKTLYTVNRSAWSTQNTQVTPNPGFYSDIVYPVFTTPHAPTIAGKKFIGWADAQTGGTLRIDPASRNADYGNLTFTLANNYVGGAAKTLYARYEDVIHTITLLPNGGTPDQNPRPAIYYKESSNSFYCDSDATTGITQNQSIFTRCNITKPSKGSDVFDGYTADASGGTRYIDSDGKILSAAFNVNTFDGDGGTRWYAQYTQTCDSTITLNPNGGNFSGTCANEFIPYYNSSTGQWMTPALDSGCLPTRLGYTFTGYRVADGGMLYYNVLNGNLNIAIPVWGLCQQAKVELEAIWEGNCNIITFDDNNGTSTSINTVQRKKSGEPQWSDVVSGNLNECGKPLSTNPVVEIPTNPHATFMGYYTDTGGTQIFGADGATTNSGNSWVIYAPATLYARWACEHGYSWDASTHTCKSEYIVQVQCSINSTPHLLNNLGYGSDFTIEGLANDLSKVCVAPCGQNQTQEGWDVFINNPLEPWGASPMNPSTHILVGTNPDATPITIMPHCVMNTDSLSYRCYVGGTTIPDEAVIGENYTVRSLAWSGCNIAPTSNFNGWLFSGDDWSTIHVAGTTIGPWNYDSSQSFVPGFNASFNCNTNYWQAHNGVNPQGALVQLGAALELPAMNCEPKTQYVGWIDTDDTNWYSSYAINMTTPVPNTTCQIGGFGAADRFEWKCPTDLVFTPNDNLITKTILVSCGAGGTPGEIEITYDTQNQASTLVANWLSEHCGGSCQNPSGPSHGYWKFCGTWGNGAVPNVTQIPGTNCWRAETPYNLNQINWANVSDFNITTVAHCPKYVKYKCSEDATNVYNEQPYSYFEESYTVLDHITVNCTDSGQAFANWKVENQNVSYTENQVVPSWPYEDEVTLVAQWGAANTYTVIYDCGDGGTGPAPANATATYNVAFTPAQNTCTNAGHDFEGWIVSNSGDIKQPGQAFTWLYLENKTLTAKWSGANDYTITYVLNGGDWSAMSNCPGASGCPATYTYGTGATINVVPTRARSQFLGWCKNADLTDCNTTQIIGATETGNKTFYAKWECVDPYHSNAAGTSCEACPDNTYYNPTDPDLCSDCPDDFPFSKWPFTWSVNQCYRDCPDGSACVDDANVGNNFSSTCTLTEFSNGGKQVEFKGNYGNVDTCGVVTYCPYGLGGCGLAEAYKPMSAPVDFWGKEPREKVGTYYIFGKRAGGYSIDLGTGDIWSQIVGPAQKGALMQNTIGGQPVEYQYTYIFYPIYTAPSADIPGYTFNGYYYPENNGTRYIEGDYALNHANAQDVVDDVPGDWNTARPLYATLNNGGYTPNTYTVIYDCGDGGTGPAPANATATYNVSFTPAQNTCTNAGHDFEGWVVSNSGDIKQPGVAFTWLYLENKTFTAKWSGANDYIITYKPNYTGATQSDVTQTVTFGAPFTTKPAGTFTRDGFRMIAWGGDPITQPVTPYPGLGETYTYNNTQDINLFAQWEMCAAGTYSNGLICKDCPSGYPQSEPGASAIEQCYKDCSVPCTTVPCPANSTCTQTNTVYNGTQYYGGACDAVPQNCEIITITCNANYYLNGTICQPCPNGTTSPAGSTSIDQCVPVLCGDGQYLNNITCENCPNGYPHSDPNATSQSQCYKDCTTACVNPTSCPVANATCTYGPNPNQGHLYYGTQSCDAAALTCPVSSFTCLPGYGLNSAGNGCIQCPAGTYSINGVCEPCPDGSISGAGATSCEPCPNGTVPNASGTACEPCPEGYVPNTAGTDCEPCPANTYWVNGTCEPCPEGYTSAPGSTSCVLSDCPTGQHIEHGACVNDVIECDAPHATNAKRTWNITLKAYGSCKIIACESGFHIASNACVPDEQVCTVTNGRGERVWSGTQWGACEITQCDPGFEISGNTCRECSNRRVNGEIAVSSYASECEIATCMYQGQKYILRNNWCEPICETASDTTGTKHWDNNAKKCVRTCNPGYKMW